jgi:tRNA modification GTPase
MTPDLQDTIVALSSAPGPGARAIVRLSGPAALHLAVSLFSGREAIDPSRRRVYSGALRLTGVAAPLPADLHVWPAPRTYTGQDLVEIHTVSCPPLIDVLIADLLTAGARAAQPGEFTLRAFLAGKLDLTRAEAVLAVIEAGNREDLKAALDQLAGGVARPLQRLRDDLLNLLADLEAGLDFTEEDIRFVQQEELLGRVTQGLAQVTLLKKQLEQRSIGSRTFRVVLAGRPNAGKSSLWNALAKGPTALVSSEPGTTRDYLKCVLNFDGQLLELIDTAGWDDADDPINAQAQEFGTQQARQADLILLCLEAGRTVDQQEVATMGRQPPPIVVPIATKCDLAEAPPGCVPTSAVTGHGLAELRELLITHARNHAQTPLAPSLSRCLHHVEGCTQHFRQAHDLILDEEPGELLALELRGAIDEIGEMIGAVYTDDLLDRVFSRFCIGK